MNDTLMTDTTTLRVNNIVCMHAIGSDASRMFHMSTGRVNSISSKRNLSILLITKPASDNPLVGSRVDFILGNSGWAYEILAGEWDF